MDMIAVKRMILLQFLRQVNSFKKHGGCQPA
jgi:hypothetical protein